VTSTPRRAFALHVQLIAAFAVLSLVAVGVLLVVDELGIGSTLDELDRPEREAVSVEAAHLAGEAYGEAGGWVNADLNHAKNTAEGAGARLNIIAADGRNVSGPPPGGGSGHGDGPEERASDIITVPITSDGKTVGTTRLLFISEQAAAHRAHDFLWGWTLLAGALALATATAGGWFMAGRLSRPLSDLADAAERYADGNRDVRTDLDSRVSEVRRLAGALDTMARSVDRSQESRKRMIADAAHELRNPLAVLQGQLEEMRDGYMPADAAALEALHEETLRLARVVDDLGNLAEAELPQLLRPAPIDLASVATQAAEARRAAFEAAGIGLVVLADPAPTLGDADRLGQVTANLLDNCVRYCRAGDQCTLWTQTDGDDVFLTLDDTGPGIPEADRAQVFDRRYRGANAADTPGSGIGLSVVRGLVRAHHGDVTVTDSPDGGTRVVVRLPSHSASAGSSTSVGATA
jgi:two-component system sensor histidine kinase BaeS